MTRQDELRKMVAEATAEEPNWAASLRKAAAMNKIGDMAPTLAADLADALDREEKLRAALKGWVSAVDEMVAFEAANPNDSTEAWTQRLYALKSAEVEARAAFTAASRT